MNLPNQFVDRIRHQLGVEAESFLNALQTTPPVSLRLHTGKFEGNLALESIPWATGGYYLAHRPVFTLDPLFHAGTYYVQDASSMLLEQAVCQLQMTARPVKVLDLCAAPGGKSTHLLNLLHAESLLVTNEVIRSRAWVLAENVTKHSNINAVVSNNDPSAFGALGEMFDLLVVDAPCSGEGLFRKNSDSVNEWSLENLQLCADRQRRILADALPSLKVDGSLIYSTCTFRPEENEGIVRWLIQEHGMELVKLDVDETWGFTRIEIAEASAWQSFPHRVGGEGFFMAVLRKRQPSTQRVSIRPVRKRPRSRKNRRGGCDACEVDVPSEVSQGLEVTSRRQAQAFTDWIRQESPELRVVHRGSQAFAVAKSCVDDLIDRLDVLKIITVGVPLGEWKKHGVVPGHGLVLSEIFAREKFPMENLDWESALRYLRREPIETSLPDGIGYVGYHGHPLGFVKQIGQRSNNWYPQEWRIRMPLPDVQPWSLMDELSR